MSKLVYKNGNACRETSLPVHCVRSSDCETIGKVVEAISNQDHERQRTIGCKLQSGELTLLISLKGFKKFSLDAIAS